MRERPIPFNGAMIRAILDGRKGSTRRLVAAPPTAGWAFDGEYGRITSSHRHKGKFGAFVRRSVGTDLPEVDLVPCPYGAPGDRLWVRESGIYSELAVPEDPSQPGVFIHDIPATPGIGHYWIQRTRAPGASYNTRGVDRESHKRGLRAKVVPSIHMPRWASRILLQVTAVGVERLQDIRPEQAVAEGIIRAGSGWRGYEEGPWFASPIGAFGSLWEQINGVGSWEANPWVWAIGFMPKADTPQPAASEGGE